MSSVKFRLKKKWIKHEILNEMNHNGLMTEIYKKTRKFLNYVKNLLILKISFRA